MGSREGIKIQKYNTRGDTGRRVYLWEGVGDVVPEQETQVGLIMDISGKV